MIAMDVVDTLRHREGLVAREFDEAGREQELIARLKEIYRQQGIEVPDHVLAEGVKALKESRFTYLPPPPGLERSLLTAWTRRKTLGAVAGVALAVLGSTCGYHYATVTRPAMIAEERARVELTETLPKAIRQAHQDLVKLTSEPAVRQKADQLLADGERAIRDRDRAGMSRAGRALEELREDVAREYTLTIVSRPGETSGVWRVPKTNPGQRNYYLVVEAFDPRGQKLRLPVLNEETGATETVDKFAMRVQKDVFDAVAADKRDDGIIQKNRFGLKRRGTLAVEYLMGFEGGMITRW
jgi:hypothetical protein